MNWRSLLENTPKRMRRLLLLSGAAFLLFWFLFLDSHSLFSRVQWHREKSNLHSENELLRSQIADLQDKLSRPLSDEEIERIAREHYGMTRPGEVVYPVEEK